MVSEVSRAGGTALVGVVVGWSAAACQPRAVGASDRGSAPGVGAGVARGGSSVVGDAGAAARGVSTSATADPAAAATHGGGAGGVGGGVGASRQQQGKRS